CLDDGGVLLQVRRQTGRGGEDHAPGVFVSSHTDLRLLAGHLHHRFTKINERGVKNIVLRLAERFPAGLVEIPAFRYQIGRDDDRGGGAVRRYSGKRLGRGEAKRRGGPYAKE